MELKGVPDSIPFERVQEMLTSLGLPLDQIVGSGVEGAGVRLNMDSITCRLYALDADGHRYADRSTMEVATHTITIPIVRADDEAADDA